MEKSQIPPLQILTLRPAPLNLHCLSWSSDAELAVAVDDCIHVFLPTFPSVRRPGDGPSSTGGVPPPQYTLTLRISTKIRPEPAINRQLFAFNGSVELPQTEDEIALTPLGEGPVTGSGAAMFQVVRVEWSPAGLGCNLRPILLALLTTGMMVAFGEHVDESEAGLRSRTIKMWKILWGLGGPLPIPDSEEKAGYRFMDERITSFSWAKEIAVGRALLAYRNDEGDIALMSVQFHKRRKPGDSKLTDGWEVQEVARFRANGPHADVDELDPDFIPSGSAFSLKWSPWVSDGETLTATLAYVAPNYVGFRRVTITADWVRGQAPAVEVEAADTVATCLSLSSDAFVEWEDAIWTEGDGRQIARGYIGTPLQVKAFEVPMTGTLQPPVSKHSTADCDTAYGEEDETTNPIAGVVIHPPDSASKPPLPLYSLARLSATGANKDWYETNLPDELSALPSWVERIRKNSMMLVSRARIMGGAEPESESEDIDEDQSEAEDVPEKLENPFRFRVWGMAASPGGLFTAVVVSKYSSLYPQRRGVCHVYFGRERLPTKQNTAGLTTEGKMWEWMYADGPPVPAVTVADKVKIEDEQSSSGSKLRQVFSGVLDKQVCVFCDGKLSLVGDSALCENGHAWAACVATGLAIMEPGITHVCAVCGMRCLRRSALETLAAEHLGPEAVIPQGSAACEGCGGKFVV